MKGSQNWVGVGVKFSSENQEDAREMWYKRKDYKLFKKEIDDCVRKRETALNQGVFEFRGIEHITAATSPEPGRLSSRASLLPTKQVATMKP